MRYELTSAQAAFLEKARRPPSDAERARVRPAHVRFPGTLPPIADQAVRGTCVANAVVALVACYEGCRRRPSVQYLDEVTRLVEQEWVARNLALLSAGGQVESDFEAAFPEAVSQAALLVRANGVGSEAATAFVRMLGAKIRARVEADSGCRLKRCFEALEKYGVCREELWPYSPVAISVGATGGDAVGSFPPGTHEDARRHRIVNGLYILRAPNNVDEIKGLLAGARGRRPMPVCVGLELFEGLTDGYFRLPEIVREDGRAFAAQRPLGIHEVLLIAATDDTESPGGGYFTFQNSWGRSWGEDGVGCVPYAYLACFCREAGTILQEPDDYGPGVATPVKDETYVSTRRRLTMMCAVGICLAAMVISVIVAVWALRAARSQSHVPPPPPFPNATAGSEAAGKSVYYRFLVSGTCDSNVEALGMAYALDGVHREFAFEDVHLTDDRRGFEGEMVIEGTPGRLPDVLETIASYLKRKQLEPVVRKWNVQPLRHPRDPRRDLQLKAKGNRK